MSATPKQVALIEDLFIRKGIPAPIQETTRALYTRQDQRPAHEIRTLIDGMFALPDAKRPAAATPRANTNDLLRSLEVPTSRFAVPTHDLTPDVQHLAHGNSLLFCEVREFKETRYLRVLRGAPGSFNREKISSRSTEHELVRQIATDPRSYAQAFGEHYSCCGSCGAELSDDQSRALHLGPECRKKFGL